MNIGSAAATRKTIDPNLWKTKTAGEESTRGIMASVYDWSESSIGTTASYILR